MKNKSIRLMGLLFVLVGVGIMVFTFVSITGLVVTGDAALNVGSMVGTLLFILGIILIVVGKEDGSGFREFIEAFSGE